MCRKGTAAVLKRQRRVGQMVEHGGVSGCQSHWAGRAGNAIGAGGAQAAHLMAAPCRGACSCLCHGGLAPDLQTCEGGESWVLNLDVPQSPAGTTTFIFGEW